MTRAIFSEGCKSVAAGMNPMDLRRGINMAVDHVISNLKARTKMISTKEEITQVRGRVRGCARPSTRAASGPARAQPREDSVCRRRRPRPLWV